MKKERIPGGKSKGMSLRDIAIMHCKSDSDEGKVEKMLNHLKLEFKKGIKTELEHTTDKNIAREIAMDHLYEDPKYYTKLSKIEEGDLVRTIRKTIRQYLNENIVTNDIKDFLIDGKYLFHYTLTDYLDDILTEGLIPRKNPNSYYTDGSEGVFLTTSQSLYKSNLPQSLIDIMSEYYEDEESYETKPIVRLWIDVTKLDLNKLYWDDDYILNTYGFNKAVSDQEKIIESLDIWGSVSYIGNIPKNYIVKYDFDYFS